MKGRASIGEACRDPTAAENLEKPSGRGILLMEAYMDRVVWSNGGRKVKMIKAAPWEEIGLGRKKDNHEVTKTRRRKEINFDYREM